MSSSNKFSLEKSVPIFDGENFLEWQAQMTAYLQTKGWWHIVNGTITLPVAGVNNATQAQVDAWETANEMALGALTLRLAHTLRTGMVGATAALTWTNLNTQFARTGVSAVYQDFKAAMRVKIGTGNPAKDITQLTTHLERLRANGVAIPDYVQGMMLLNAIPDEWDHVAACYVQTTTQVANVAIGGICTAIMAEHDRLGGTRQNQSHVADKISAVKRKGKSPKFSNQRSTDYEPASNEAGPSSFKKRGSRGGKGKGKAPGQGQGSHHHSHLASRLEMNAELNSRPLFEWFLAQQVQPAESLNRALGDVSARVQQQNAVRSQVAHRPKSVATYPFVSASSTTVGVLDPSGIKHLNKPTKCSAQAFTGQPSKPGPATLPEARSIAERLDVTPSIENLKSLEALRKHRGFVEKS
jgi:hypothetical protein